MVIARDTFLLSVADTDAQWLCRGERQLGDSGMANGEPAGCVISGILKRILRRNQVEAAATSEATWDMEMDMDMDMGNSSLWSTSGSDAVPRLAPRPSLVLARC